MPAPNVNCGRHENPNYLYTSYMTDDRSHTLPDLYTAGVYARNSQAFMRTGNLLSHLQISHSMKAPSCWVPRKSGRPRQTLTVRCVPLHPLICDSNFNISLMSSTFCVMSMPLTLRNCMILSAATAWSTHWDHLGHCRSFFHCTFWSLRSVGMIRAKKSPVKWWLRQISERVLLPQRVEISLRVEKWCTQQNH